MLVVKRKVETKSLPESYIDEKINSLGTISLVFLAIVGVISLALDKIISFRK